ncbi:hypothetical protein [Litchfieldia alkalitelluris]|uniref:hypothetical protein n=1 Tax=Litchfieldia alkalitelluris TaxID=304268 RepID=UPI00195C1B91|nr:hypothetical protein [Litchfieldia alkalitelluris]
MKLPGEHWDVLVLVFQSSIIIWVMVFLSVGYIRPSLVGNDDGLDAGALMRNQIIVLQCLRVRAIINESWVK